MKRNVRTARKVFKFTNSLAYMGVLYFENFLFGRKKDPLKVGFSSSNKDIYTYKKVMRLCYKRIKELKKEWRNNNDRY